jgi:hypothetical protein
MRFDWAPLHLRELNACALKLWLDEVSDMSDLPPRIVPVSSFRSRVVETLNDAPEGQWSVLVFPHERVEGKALNEFVKAIGELPADVEGVRAQLILPSATGERAAWALRAVRTGKARPATPLPEDIVRVAGQTVQVQGYRLVVERSKWQDPVALAERDEEAGDFVSAMTRWRSLGEARTDEWGAYFLTRAAAATALLGGDGAPSLRPLLLSALDRCPSLPETALRFASCWMVRGDVEQALRWAEWADAVRSIPPSVPHLEGTGAWLVPERMATWLHAFSHPLAAQFAQEAIRRSVVDSRRSHMVEISEFSSVPSQPPPEK